MLCKYGCGKKAIYKDRCDKLSARCSINRKKISNALIKAHKNHPESWIGKTGWCKGLTKETDRRILRRSINLKKNGNCTGKAKTRRKELLRRKHISNTTKGKGITGGYRKNSGRTIKTYVLDSFGNKVCLQGSYEVLCSKILNKLKIKWIRPTCLWYNQHTQRYFPDFYLIDYSIYLDPKNDFLIKKDKNKIQEVLKENKIKLYILSKLKISEEFIQKIISPCG